MSGSPLVSIITPTWGRPELVRETVAHVRRQTYPNIEHLVVYDGPDDQGWRHTLTTTPSGGCYSWEGSPYLRSAALGWRPTEELRDSFAVGALMMGALMARGEYHMWLCDDERMAANHVELMVQALEEPEPVDFVYPRVYTWKPGEPDRGISIGSDPPCLGTVTSVLYRRSCLDKGMYRFHLPLPPGAPHAPHDWDMVHRWMKAGASWRFVDRETLSHRSDH